MEFWSEFTNQHAEGISKYIDEFAAAFLKKTGIDNPEDVIMFRQDIPPENYLAENNPKFITKIWFEKKTKKYNLLAEEIKILRAYIKQLENKVEKLEQRKIKKI